jgi:hypothetical protein
MGLNSAPHKTATAKRPGNSCFIRDSSTSANTQLNAKKAADSFQSPVLSFQFFARSSGAGRPAEPRQLKTDN